TAFLLGPAQQLGMMFDTVRVFATVMYVGCVVIALICALWIHSKLLTIIAIIIEIVALIWTIWPLPLLIKTHTSLIRLFPLNTLTPFPKSQITLRKNCSSSSLHSLQKLKVGRSLLCGAANDVDCWNSLDAEDLKAA
ncbi:hypothetical protein PIB30_029540, partial [Stylosanthes scabra]|nr:hypothetical protein [Stylosanthes scabra]